jgi:chemotaxis protein histidine kinase CheA
MPTIRPPHHPPRRYAGSARHIPALVSLSLGAPLMALAAAAQAQVPAGVSSVNMEGMELTSILALVQQQRAELRNADPAQQTKQEQQQQTKEQQELKAALEQLQQKIKREEQTKQQQTEQQQATQEQVKQQQTKQKTTKESQQQMQQEQERKEKLEQLQQKGEQEQQVKQEQTATQEQTKQAQQTQPAKPGPQETKQEQQTKSPSSASSRISSPALPRQQLLALLGAGEKSSAAPTTTSEVAAYLASGQGNSNAQAQLAVPAGISAGSATVVGPEPTKSGAIQQPDGMPLPVAISAGAVAGVSTGAAVAAVTQVAIASGIPTGSAAVQSALQQQLEQAATNAAQQQAFAYVTSNMVTPLASFPTSKQATYTGPVGGTLNSGASVSGTFQATVDFATIKSGAPVVPGSITFSNGQGGTTFTLSLLGGYLGGGMSGTYAGQAVTGFVMNGRFYGPTGEQLAGSWSMQNGGGSLSGAGSFKAQR